MTLREAGERGGRLSVGSIIGRRSIGDDPRKTCFDSPVAAALDLIESAVAPWYKRVTESVLERSTERRVRGRKFQVRCTLVCLRRLPTWIGLVHASRRVCSSMPGDNSSRKRMHTGHRTCRWGFSYRKSLILRNLPLLATNILITRVVRFSAVRLRSSSDRFPIFAR